MIDDDRNLVVLVRRSHFKRLIRLPILFLKYWHVSKDYGVNFENRIRHVWGFTWMSLVI